ncbi:MAG: family 43 glycosylhydrolase [Clostridium sp.]|uniref:lipocalin-like domain-containing protein n=1 Tax=Clostridium sp. TaxID=1506 RepID=UPI0025C72B74|nr:glycoside hydrolase family 43 C-terminal domain-containing protein [Clostridium sp.]MBS4956211.1 family 43 glycosylhydrolase [Clostridium sp.]
MKSKKVRKILAFFMTGVLISSFGLIRVTTAKEKIEAKTRVSVHDPSIVKDGDEYYVFGSHIDAAKSTDLQNWIRFTNGYTTPDNVIFGDLSENLAGSFAWAGEDDSDSKGGFSVWAPTVFWNDNYVNDNGTKGAYMMYYCTSSTYKRSAIGYAVSQNIEGPYTYVDTIMYSGFTKNDAYDSNSTKNTKYVNTHIDELIEEDVLEGLNDSWFNADGSYNTSYAPNAIDPELFYDKNGQLWMTYGSWSGGIYILKIDDTTGQPIYPGADADQDSLNLTDRYFGKRISGGYTQSGEGADVVYDKETGYYYMTVTYGGLAADGGYNMRLFRSENPEGPYLDSEGRNAALPGNVSNTNYGIKLISNYKFDCQDTALKAAGHNSVLLEEDGDRYLIHHQRFDNGTEYHEVRVHQMFVNKEGWLVVAPYENSGDEISQTGYSKEEIVGNYQFINHGTDTTSSIASTLNITLNEDFTVSGDITGTWTMEEDTYYMTITTNDVTYSGVFFKQQDESLEENKVMTFTATGNNNESVWGSKLELDDLQAVEYTGKDLENKIPSVVKSNIELPTVGPYDTTINWKSSNENSISNKGKVKRTGEDETVVLTATITKGESVITKEFTVLVKGVLQEVGVNPIYKYDFESLENQSIANTGSKNGSATLVGTASVVKDEERGNVLEVTNEKGAAKVNYLALPTDTFEGIIGEGYTVSMWVNVDKNAPNYFEHSALFEASMINEDGTPNYPITRISANLFGRINANGSWSDATEISKPLEGNKWEYVTYTVSSTGIVVYVDGNEVARQDKDIADCFKDNFLALMTDVRVGSGNIWSDMDIANAKFDNVAVYNVALSDKQVEALYNDEKKQDEDQENPENPQEPGDTVNPGNGDLENVDSGNKPTVNNNVNTSKLPQTGAVNVLFTLALGGVSITIGGISLKKKKL